jgi:tripartite-type tricarboxylate transporter receptor subunit TctC
MNALSLNLTSVPYRGTSLAMNDLVGGQVDLLCDSVATAPPYIQSGKVKAYAVTSKQRAASLPDTPSLHELGLTDFDTVNWTALYAPKNTPQPIIQTLTLKLQDALQDPDLQAALKRIGSEPMPRERATPEAARAYLQSELKRWDALIKKAQIKLN